MAGWVVPDQPWSIDGVGWSTSKMRLARSPGDSRSASPWWRDPSMMVQVGSIFRVGCKQRLNWGLDENVGFISVPLSWSTEGWGDAQRIGIEHGGGPDGACVFDLQRWNDRSRSVSVHRRTATGSDQGRWHLSRGGALLDDNQTTTADGRHDAWRREMPRKGRTARRRFCAISRW